MEVVNLKSMESISWLQKRTSHLLCFGPHIFCGLLGGNSHSCTAEVWHPTLCNYGSTVDIPTQHSLEENQLKKMTQQNQ